MSLLLGCSSVSGSTSGEATGCPPPVHPWEEVGEELLEIPFEGNEDLYQWIDLVERLNEQLEACRED